MYNMSEQGHSSTYGLYGKATDLFLIFSTLRTILSSYFEVFYIPIIQLCNKRRR